MTVLPAARPDLRRGLWTPGGAAGYGGSALGRAIRAAVFTVATVALALAAHLLGGGIVPQRHALVAIITVVWVGAFALAGRERGASFLGALVVSTQLALHAVFTVASCALPISGAGAAAGGRADSTAAWAKLLFCHHGPGSISAAQVATARSAMGLASTDLPASTGAGAPAPTGSLLGSVLAVLAQAGPATAMLVMHLLAALAMAWWLRRGERAAWAAGGRVVALVAAQLRLHGFDPLSGLVSDPGAITVGRAMVHEHRFAHSVGKRGPPAAPRTD